MKRCLLVLLVACGDETQTSTPPPQGSASAAKPIETISAQLVGCSPALAAPSDPRDRLRQGLGNPFDSIGPVGGTIVPRGGPRVQLQTPSVTGAMNSAIVRRYLRRAQNQFLFCYEKEILRNKPTLVGPIEVSFAINHATGTVISATATGVDAAVGKCIADQIKNLEFPRPRDDNNVQVTVRMDLQNSNVADPAARPTPGPRPRITREWTPFAVEEVSLEDAAQTTTEVTRVATERLPAVEQCFDGARGAIRAIVALDSRGTTTHVRAGGIGDSSIESCIARALGGISATPRAAPVEIACDFARGGDAPLRVSPDAGYTVIELTNKEVSNRSSVREIPPRGTNRGVTMLGGSASVLVVAEPDAPAHGLEYALWWAPPGSTLVAVKASGGAPVFLGMGDSRAQREAATAKRLVQLRTDKGKLVACLDSDLRMDAPLLDARAMDRVLQAVAAACKQTACEPTVVVGTSGDFIAKELVATTSAARRAGFHAISIGGPACD